MSIENLFVVQMLFLLLQVVMVILSFKLDRIFLLYTSYLCSAVVICLMFVIILS